MSNRLIRCAQTGAKLEIKTLRAAAPDFVKLKRGEEGPQRSGNGRWVGLVEKLIVGQVVCKKTLILHPTSTMQFLSFPGQSFIETLR